MIYFLFSNIMIKRYEIILNKFFFKIQIHISLPLHIETSTWGKKNKKYKSLSLILDLKSRKRIYFLEFHSLIT